MPQLPIKFPSFKDFVNVKDKAMAVLYVAFIAIGILFAVLKKNYNEQGKKCETTNEAMSSTIVSMRVDMDLMQLQLRRADSTMADMAATLRILKQVGKIP